ncbi:MAG: UDP-N-acetylmuramoyl-L-alanyl-D-glutamate--2,6-diaminopimelate ligase [Planctomycetota bacterium]
MGVELMTLVRSIGGAIGNPGQVPAGLVLTGVQLDSRRVQPGDLFVALAGSQRDGWSFVPQAIERGAAAILASDLPAGMALPIPVWLHPDPRRALGLAAATFAGNPSRDLEVVAITGTNGKTTTAFLLRSLLRAQGQDPALLGTTGYYLARGVFEPATHTTPDAITLQHLFARQREVDGGTVIMEASSHALDQERLAGTSVDLAVFTNLSRDHLDYHGDMESYAASKARLFACLDRHGAAVLNADDHEYPRMVHAARAAGARVLSTSLQSPADLWANHLRTDTSGTRFDLHGLGFSATGIHVPLLGAHNISNLLQALACARWLGHDTAGLLAALPHLQPRPVASSRFRSGPVARPLGSITRIRPMPCRTCSRACAASKAAASFGCCSAAAANGTRANARRWVRWRRASPTRSGSLRTIRAAKNPPPSQTRSGRGSVRCAGRAPRLAASNSIAAKPSIPSCRLPGPATAS